MLKVNYYLRKAPSAESKLRDTRTLAQMKRSKDDDLSEVIAQNSPRAIYACLCFKGKRVIIYPGVSVEPLKWDFTNKMPKPIHGDPELSYLKEKLHQKESIFRRIYNEIDLKNNGHVSPVDLKKEIELHLGRSKEKEKKVEQVSVISFFDTMINDSRSGKRLTPDNTVIKEQSIKPYCSTKHHFQEFEKINGTSYNLSNMTQDIVNDFREHLVNSLNDKEEPLSLNSIAKYMQVFKLMLCYAKDKKLLKATLLHELTFIVRREGSDNIFLDEKEINLLINFSDFSTPVKEHVRDLFVIGCYTGLRFSDFSVLKKEDVYEDHIRIIQTKTGDPVTIPVHPIVKRIFEKYNYRLPKCPPNQVFNRYLKDIGEKIPELSVAFKKQITRARKKEKKEMPKWSMLQTHTARRSFCSNLYLKGWPIGDIMILSGHKSGKSFGIYIKDAIARRHAESMAERLKQMG